MSTEHDEMEVGRRVRGIGTLLIIIVVFLWLAAQVLLPHPQYVGKKAKIKATKVQIEGNFATTLETFKSKVGRHPTTAEGLGSAMRVRDPVVLPHGEWDGPLPEDMRVKVPRDPWNNEYQYVCPGTHNVDGYDLWSFGPDGKDDGGDDVTNWKENP
jgi:general secretion pathway protein G